jgi:hypothetical protein
LNSCTTIGVADEVIGTGGMGKGADVRFDSNLIEYLLEVFSKPFSRVD